MSSIVTRCNRCGQPNRVPVTRLFESPKCGACKAELPVGSAPIDVTDADLQDVLAASPVPVVVDFWAPWCGPCRMVGPVLDDLAHKLSGKVLFAKLNVDDNPQMAARYNARSIPLLLGFANGKKVAEQVGALPPPQLASWVGKVAAAR